MRIHKMLDPSIRMISMLERCVVLCYVMLCEFMLFYVVLLRSDLLCCVLLIECVKMLFGMLHRVA